MQGFRSCRRPPPHRSTFGAHVRAATTIRSVSDPQAVELLQETLRLQPAVEAAVILGPEGEVEAVASSSDAAETDLSPVLTLLVTTAERAVRELGRGGLATVLIEGTQGYLLVLDLGSGRVLGVVAGAGVAPGLLIDDAQAIADQVTPRAA